jgi:hypothetical protein
MRKIGIAKILRVITIGSAVFPTALAAEQAEITVQGTAEGSCRVISAEFESKNINIGILNAVDGTLEATAGAANLGVMTCNHGANISIKSQNGGLVRQGTIIPHQPPFVDRVNYQITADWGPGTRIVNYTTNNTPNGGPAPYNTTDARSAELLVEFETHKNTSLSMIPGVYQDIVIVEVSTSQ